MRRRPPCDGSGLFRVDPEGLRQMTGARHGAAAESRAQGFMHRGIKDYPCQEIRHESRKTAEHPASSCNVSSGLIDMADVIQGGTKRKRELSTLVSGLSPKC